MSLNILEVKNLLQESLTSLEKKIKDITKEDVLVQIFGKFQDLSLEKFFSKNFLEILPLKSLKQDNVLDLEKNLDKKTILNTFEKVEKSLNTFNNKNLEISSKSKQDLSTEEVKTKQGVAQDKYETEDILKYPLKEKQNFSTEEVKTKEGVAQDKYETEDPLEVIANNGKETNKFLKQILEIIKDSDFSKKNLKKDSSIEKNEQKNKNNREESGSSLLDLWDSVDDFFDRKKPKKSRRTSRRGQRPSRRSQRPSRPSRRGSRPPQPTRRGFLNNTKRILGKTFRVISKPFKALGRSGLGRGFKNIISKSTRALSGSKVGRKISQTLLKNKLKAKRLLNRVSKSKVGQILAKPFKSLSRRNLIRTALNRRASQMAARAGSTSGRALSNVANVGKLAKAGRLVKGVAGGLGSLAGGLALDYGSEKLKEKGKIKTAAAADTASTALAYAGMGSLVGSIVPGLGTVVGGAIGGAIGTGVGLWNNAGTLFSKKPEPEKFPELMELKKNVENGKITKKEALASAQKIAKNIEEPDNFMSAADDLFGEGLLDTTKEIAQEGIRGTKKLASDSWNFIKKVSSPFLGLKQSSNQDSSKLNSSNDSKIDDSNNVSENSSSILKGAASMVPGAGALLGVASMMPSTQDKATSFSKNQNLSSDKEKKGGSFLSSIAKTIIPTWGLMSAGSAVLESFKKEEPNKTNVLDQGLVPIGLSNNQTDFPDLISNQNSIQKETVLYKDLISKNLNSTQGSNDVLVEKMSDLNQGFMSLSNNLMTALENMGGTALIPPVGDNQSQVITQGGNSHIQNIINSGRDPIFDYRLNLWNARYRSPSYVVAT